jgi:hypothetical protein
MQQQIDAVKSWLVHGKVISLNHPNEIEAIKNTFKDVEFKSTTRTARPSFQKYYVYIDDLIDLACDYNEPVMLINSDIEITEDKKIIEIIKSYAEKSCLYLHRWDYTTDKLKAKIYKLGVDAILIPKGKCKDIPSSLFFMGATHWDIWYPFAFYSTGIPLVSITSKPVIYHKEHPVQYNSSQWEILGKHCAWLMNQPGISSAQASDRCYRMLDAATNYL